MDSAGKLFADFIVAVEALHTHFAGKFKKQGVVLIEEKSKAFLNSRRLTSDYGLDFNFVADTSQSFERKRTLKISFQDEATCVVRFMFGKNKHMSSKVFPLGSLDKPEAVSIMVGFLKGRAINSDDDRNLLKKEFNAALGV